MIAVLIAVATSAVVEPVPKVLPADWALPQALLPLPPVTPVKVNVDGLELVTEPPTVVPPPMVPEVVPAVWVFVIPVPVQAAFASCANKLSAILDSVALTT